jgi:hypothetical protein
MNASMVRWRLVAINPRGNLLGAVLTSLYFEFVECEAGGLAAG